MTLEGTIIHKTGMMTGGPSMQEGAKAFDEQAWQGVQRERDQCMAQLKEVQQEKYELDDEDELHASLTRAQSSLAAVRDEAADLVRRKADVAAECTTLASTRAELDAQLREGQEALAAVASQVASLEARLHAADDEVFSEFCARIGVANVREYEAQQLQLTQALATATQDQQRHLSRLAHQRTFMEQQARATSERLAYIQATIDKETQRQPQWDAELQRCDDALRDGRAALAEVQKALQALREQHSAQSDVLQDKRRLLLATTRDLDGLRKEVAERNDEIAQLDAERTSLYRRCRLDAMDLPLLHGDLSAVPLDDDGHAPPAPRGWDVQATRDYGVQVDPAELTDAERADRSSARERELQARIDAARDAMAQLQPSTPAAAQLQELERELQLSERALDDGREQVRETKEAFQLVKKQRTDLFMKAYHHIAERIDGVYKALTQSKVAPTGGVAYLTLEETDEPFRHGIRYHTMPPMKRFRDMDQLSGGEKTMAALALLFAIHTFQPAPFFVLDEVDAALDSHNVARISEYIRAHASHQVQFIVISLKASLYERSQGLVGVYRHPDTHASASVTLDLEQYT